MTHQIWHHCGGTGEVVGQIAIKSGSNEKPLPSYSRLNLAIAFNPHGMSPFREWLCNKVIYWCRLIIYKVVQVSGEPIHAAKPTQHNWY